MNGTQGRVSWATFNPKYVMAIYTCKRCRQTLGTVNTPDSLCCECTPNSNPEWRYMAASENERMRNGR